MSTQLKNLTFGALFLLVPALLAMACGWLWNGQDTSTTAYIFFLFTQSVSRPWGILTSLVLGFLLYRSVAVQSQNRVSLLILMIVVVWGGQGIKSLLKPYFAEPRPYVVALMENSDRNPSFFYQQTKPDRQQLITEANHFWPSMPKWQIKHWQHETGYSFPSGHTFFVASWVLLFFSLLSLKKSWPLLILVMLWAWAVMWSRMMLGMHWPRDLLAAVIIAWGFTAFVLVSYHCLIKGRPEA